MTFSGAGVAFVYERACEENFVPIGMTRIPQTCSSTAHLLFEMLSLFKLCVLSLCCIIYTFVQYSGVCLYAINSLSSCAMAQTNPDNSRATAMMVFCLLFPRIIRFLYLV
jgi:hypothetical protein